MRSENKRLAAFAALAECQREGLLITKAAVARRAGVSVVFLRSHPDLLQAIEEAEKGNPTTLATTSSTNQVQDQVIAALRRRLEEMKLQLASKEAQLREKQREIDHLYGKLAAASLLQD